MVTATDLDLYEGGRVSYRIFDTWRSNLFTIDARTGEIRLNGALDYEDVSRPVFKRCSLFHLESPSPSLS